MKTGTRIGLAIGLLTGAAHGAGFQLYTEGSTEALGQAGAISGRDDLTSLAWYNPAALAGADKTAIMGGIAMAQINTDFTTPIPDSDESMSDEWRMIPHLYAVLPVTREWTLMLSVNAPYGLVTEWSDDWVGRQIATLSDLKAVYVTPSVAYRVTDALSLSLGASAVMAEAELGSVTTNGLPSGMEASQTVTGDDLGYGFSASAHLDVAEGWAVGARYQSRVSLELAGIVEFGAPINGRLDAGADLTLPSTVNLGVANTSINNLSLGVDLVWTEWSTYDQIAIETSAGDTVAAKDWKDVWSFRVGGEYALGENWKLRAGYVWDQSPVPETTRTPELPGTDRQMLMAGAGWVWNGIGIDVAYAYLWADKGDMGTIYPLPGEFETTTHLVSVSGRYAF
ncbi:OmpP1/FadL family transporter [Pontiella sp.]|uniref:OmpP1/FadL family transporter n=1 Tax=Pontiella sp. TaxID=2837462 RepID=UPI0035682C0E